MNRLKTLTLLCLFAGAVTMAADSPSPETRWMDLSTTEDGISPTFCTDVHHQWLHHKVTGLEVTSASTREGTSGTSELRNHDQAQKACTKLTNWGGHSDWRLPTVAEMAEYREDLIVLFQKPPFKDSTSEYFWTSTERVPVGFLPKDISTQDPHSCYWVLQLTPGKYRQLDPRAVVNFFCVRDTFPIAQNWRDTSRGPNGKPLKCSDEKADCIYTEIKNGLEWASATKMEDTLQTSTEAANQVCMGLNFGGTGNWRLPFFKELVQAIQDGINLLPYKESFYWDMFGMTFVYDAEERGHIFRLRLYPGRDGLDLTNIRKALLVEHDKAGPTCVRDPRHHLPGR